METTKVGCFEIGTDGSVRGPRAYLESGAYGTLKARIEAGTHCLIGSFASDTPIPVMLGVMIQTDYAAWAGMRDMEARNFHSTAVLA